MRSNKYINPNAGQLPVIPAVADRALKVVGIEVIQSIQDEENLVPLVANKTALVRIYVDPSSLPATITATAELAWVDAGGGGEHYLPTIGTVEVDPSKNQSLSGQRKRLDLSFNARLPLEAVREGKIKIRVSKMISRQGIRFNLIGILEAEVQFRPVPALRIRAVGMRYKMDNRFVSPDARHFDYLRSYLSRAYPVSEITWSQIVVEANFPAPSKGGSSVLANAQLASMRSKEVSEGMDPRTHYIALVDDDNGQNFMRGRASDIPGTPSPDTVCSSPVGRPGGFAGDNDESYSDWYGTHELGHTFGRYHPGFPEGSQDRSDLDFPYPEGRISGNGKNYIGFDAGDLNLGLPQRILEGETHHDVMTYAENQWVSAYTFKAVLERLRLEDQLVH